MRSRAAVDRVRWQPLQRPPSRRATATPSNRGRAARRSGPADHRAARPPRRPRGAAVRSASCSASTASASASVAAAVCDGAVGFDELALAGSSGLLAVETLVLLEQGRAPRPRPRSGACQRCAALPSAPPPRGPPWCAGAWRPGRRSGRPALAGTARAWLRPPRWPGVGRRARPQRRSMAAFAAVRGRQAPPLGEVGAVVRSWSSAVSSSCSGKERLEGARARRHGFPGLPGFGVVVGVGVGRDDRRRDGRRRGAGRGGPVGS